MRTAQYSIYPTSLFLEQLRLEKRRAERSNRPLSMAVLFFGAKNNARANLEFLTSIEYKIRDTDIVGYLGDDRIGLLLPDTSESGAREVVKKLHNGNSVFSSKTIIATYPDQIFDALAAEGKEKQDIDPIVFAKSVESNSFSLFIKRAIDLVGSIFGIIVLSPLMLVTALIIKLDSPGPIIFKQIRLGKKGVPFVFYKFRSMTWGADDKIHKDYVESLIKGDSAGLNQGDAEEPLYKIKSDPRVTPFGRFIRKTSIDELPQLFNVLKGDMSLVGPRPPIPYEVEKYKPWHLRRVLEKRPGITGLWQVEGRSRTSFDDMVRLDIQYIRKWSLWLDLKILLKTIKVVLRSNGAV